MPALQAWQTLRTPVVQICIPVGLRLATLALAAVLACAFAEQVLLPPQANGGRNVSMLPRVAIESNTGPAHASRSRCAAVLRDSAVLRRSLSSCADSFAACEARADTLARNLRVSKRRAKRLLRENAELRARLETVRTPPGRPTVAHAFHTHVHTHAHSATRVCIEACRICAYDCPHLPRSAVQLTQEVALRAHRACMSHVACWMACALVVLSMPSCVVCTCAHRTHDVLSVMRELLLAACPRTGMTHRSSSLCAYRMR